MPTPQILEKLNCRYADTCSGCALIGVGYQEQVRHKIADLETAWANAKIPMPLPEIKFVSIANGALRDRADFVLSRSETGAAFGLFSSKSREILDLEECLQLSPALQAWLNELRPHLPLIAKGSFRLRISPSGERGVWLDLANIDVKNLLDENSQLKKLLSLGFVEIGQKRKKLIDRDGVLKLGDPELRPWFETYLGPEEKPAAIYTTVGSFTQPGFRANKALIGEIRAALGNREFSNVVEFGSGSGNITLPLAHLAKRVRAYELDELACAGLRKGLEVAGLQSRVEIHTGNFQIAKNAPDLAGTDLIVVDPPRSGLMNFLTGFTSLSPAQKPKNFLYISCFADSFAKDAVQLVEAGYKPQSISIVDQFPQSPHYEIVALFVIE